MNQQVHWVTGKGGVGKSAVAAAMAMKFALEGRKTLLVEIGTTSFFENFLGLPQVGFHPVSYDLSSLNPNSPPSQTASGGLDVALWAGEECLKEYAIYLIKVETLYRLFFENPVSKSLIQIAPGLEELAITGKATSHPRKHGPPLDYERIVIDSFATGHFAALIKSPQAMAQSIRFGPMHDQSQSIDRYLSNPDFSKYHIVSLPEDLPTTEALELANEIEKLTKQIPQIWLNKWISLNDRPKNPNPSVFDQYLQRVERRQNHSLDRLTKHLKTQCLPMIWHTDSNQVLTGLIGAIA